MQHYNKISNASSKYIGQIYSCKYHLPWQWGEQHSSQSQSLAKSTQETIAYNYTQIYTTKNNMNACMQEFTKW